MKTVTLTIKGEPVGKGRPKFTTRNGYSMAYTPPKTREYEELIKEAYNSTYDKQVFDCEPLQIYILAYFGIPQSYSKKKQQAMADGQIRPTKKPDSDNIVKIVCDALNKVAYHDDSQIVDCLCRKFYSTEPRVEVVIKNALKDEQI